MSGGAFGSLYPYDGLSVQDVDPWQMVVFLEAAIGYLRDKEKHDAADELERFRLDYTMFFRMMDARYGRIQRLLKAVDYYAAGDHGEDTFDELWQKFLEGKL